MRDGPHQHWHAAEDGECVTFTCVFRETSTNVIEAASSGATSAVGLAVTIVVNLMVFISLMSFLDGVLSWFGGLFDFPQLSFSVTPLTSDPLPNACVR